MSYNLRSHSSKRMEDKSYDSISSCSTASPPRRTHRPAANVIESFSERSYKWFFECFKISWVSYILVLFGAVFGGGSLIRLYGNTCGLNIMNPSSWLTAFVTIGSPWCKVLNWVGYMTTSIVEHLWFHLFGVLMTSFVVFVPGKMRNLSPGQYTDER